MKPIIFTLLLAGGILVNFSRSVHADVLDNWTTNQITTNSFELHHVVYGNGHYVAVAEYGDGGEIYSSEDGLNWSLRFSDNNSWGLTLNYSGGCFSGVGGFGVVDVSTNGTNWTSAFLPVYDYNAEMGQAITYGNGVYVTVGDTNGIGNIQTSPDGATWTSSGITPAPGGRISSIAYGPRKFVAIGNNDGFEYTSTGVSAGTTWTRSSIPGGQLVSYANGLFIVPLNNKTNLITSDGINWNQKATGLTNMLGKVNFGNGIFMAQCGVSIAGSYLATSIDGTNWIQYPKPLPNSWSSSYDLPDPDVSLATDGTRLVAVGATGSYPFNSFIYTSDVLVGVRMTNTPSRQVALSGLVGRNYQIQSADSLGADSIWRTNTTMQITNTPFVWADSTATNSARFYRGALLP